jgi:hypothetical protein
MTLSSMTPLTKTFPVLPLLLLLTLSAHATLVPGIEKGVTTPVLDVPAFDQSSGRIATDGDAFLAVWIDRAAVFSGDVHGARFSPDGKRLGDEVLRIAVTDADEGQVALAFGANRYLVVWSAGTVLRGRFVERDGAMSEVFEIAPIAWAGFSLQVAFNGERFLVTWPMETVFRGALLDTNGAVLKTFDIAPSAQTGYQPQTVAANGAFQFFTAITDFTRVPSENGYPHEVGLAPIDGNGTVGARVVIAPAVTPVFDLRAVSSGTEVVVAWSTAVGIPGGTVRAVRVTSAGAGAIETIPAEGMYLHDVAVDAGGFFVIYGADSTKYIRRLGASTSTVMATPPTPTSILDVASSGARTLALVRGNARLGFEYGAAGADLYVSRLDTQDIEPVVVAPRHQSLPDVAAAGDFRLAVWCEYVGSERRLAIVGSRLNADGNTLDPGGIDVHASVYRPSGPRVASNGTDWLVVWIDTAKLYASRIAHDGTLIDRTPVQITTHVYADSEVAVSWDGTQYIVVFMRGDYFRGPRTTVHAVRVTAQGAITAPELLFAEQAWNELPAVASGPEGSLLLWRQGSFLQGALLSRSGTITPIAFPAIPATSRPSVAWNHGTFLVAAGFRGSFGDEIQWLLVSDTGVVRPPLSPFLDHQIGSPNSSPTIELEAYGDAFLLFWNGTANDTVYVSRINGDGILTDAPVPVGTTLGGYTPNFGAAGNMVVYAHRIGHTTREIARVFAQRVQHFPGKPKRRAVR